MRMRCGLMLVVVLVVARSAAAQSPFPPPVERDFVVRDVRFDSGDVAAEIRLHYH